MVILLQKKRREPRGIAIQNLLSYRSARTPNAGGGCSQVQHSGIRRRRSEISLETTSIVMGMAFMFPLAAGGTGAVPGR
jgi:hypothetical protein